MAALTEVVLSHLRKLEKSRKDQDVVIRKINKIHAKLCQTAPERAEKFGDKLWNKLRGFYEEAKLLADAEEGEVGRCMRELETLWGLPSSSNSNRKKAPADWSDQHKRKRAKGEPLEPASSSGGGVSARGGGASPSQAPWAGGDSLSIAIGVQVAARVTPDDAPKDDWIVVKVTRYDRDSNRFEVIDEEPGDDEESAQRKYRLQASSIIPFPKSMDPSSAADFAPGSYVLAVYPGTTSLYRACVVGPPRKRKGDNYFLAFDDDEEEGVEGLPQRQVPFFHVVPLPDGHRQ